jgi:hypothetical protein
MKRATFLLVIILLVLVLACLGTGAAASQTGSGVADVFQADAIRQQAKANKEMAEALQVQSRNSTASQFMQLVAVGMGFTGGLLVSILFIAMIIAIFYVFLKKRGVQRLITETNQLIPMAQTLGLPAGASQYPYPVETQTKEEIYIEPPEPDDNMFSEWWYQQ